MRSVRHVQDRFFRFPPRPDCRSVRRRCAGDQLVRSRFRQGAAAQHPGAVFLSLQARGRGGDDRVGRHAAARRSAHQLHRAEQGGDGPPAQRELPADRQRRPRAERAGAQHRRQARPVRHRYGSLKLFGPTTGKLMSTLKQAGIDPKDVVAVVMSHAHIDHCGGCVADDGSRNFPNAQYYITQADYDFWTDETKVPPAFKVFLDTARKNLTPNRDRIHFIKDGEEFLPGIQAILAPGHTVGHTIFMINSGGKSLCYIGDLAHHPVLLLEKPLTEFMYDTDPKQSAQSRVKMLTMLAANRIPLLAYHFAWPGVGHVAKQGDGFRYYPEPMNMVL